MKSMTPEQAQQITRNAIAIALVKNRGKIIALLRSHGINVDSGYKDDQLIVAILVAIQSKVAFRKDLHKLLLETAAANTSNFTGESGFFFTAENGSNFFYVDKVGDEKTAKEKTAAGLFLQQNLGTILNQGLATISTVLTNKSNGKIADKALAIEQEKTRQAALLAAGVNQGGPLGQRKLSTGAVIGIGIGIAAVIGVIIYFVVKKK